ncbi:MAG TPA: hypothetical protein VMR21_07210 [Vicinamibacteria bacterium]|nr:hypothetical protein [Vicinamibacteria bacterium]
MPRTTSSAMAVLCGLLAAASEGAEPDRGFRLAAVTPDFLFYSRHGEPIDVGEVERSLRRVEALLGQRVPGRAAYYRYGTPQEVAANVGPYAAGVTFGRLRQIHSIRKSHLHEVVHLVAAHLGDPGPFFQEGLAVALAGADGGGRPLGRRPLPRRLRALPFSAVVAGFEGLAPETSYPMAGSFVSFLIEAHSLPRVVAFFRACAGEDARPEQAFRATFGLSLDEAGETWSR